MTALCYRVIGNCKDVIQNWYKSQYEQPLGSNYLLLIHYNMHVLILYKLFIILSILCKLLRTESLCNFNGITFAMYLNKTLYYSKCWNVHVIKNPCQSPDTMLT